MADHTYIGYVALEGLFIIPLAVIWFISLCNASRASDPARTGVAWMKVVFPLWTLSLMLLTVGGGIIAWLNESDYDYYYRADFRRAASHINVTGTLFGLLAEISLLVTFVELAAGFLLCLRPDGQPNPARKYMRASISIWAAILLVLVVAYFGVSQSYSVQYWTGSTALARKLLLSMLKLGAAIGILLWITCIPVLGVTCYVVNKTRSFELLHDSAVVVVVAAVLDFIRLTFNMASLIRWNLVDPYDSDTAPYVWNIVFPFFDTVFMFILLVLLFAVATRTQRGLWSKPQPAWSYPAPGVVYVPAMMAVPVAAPGQGGVVMQPPQAQLAQQPNQNLPAYLQVAQQKQQQEMMQQQQQQYGQPQYGQQAAPQAYYYPQPQPQQQQQPVAAPAPAVAQPQPVVTTA